MRAVFLSYRRDDTQTVSGFIYQHLTAPAGFGPDGVFMDIDTIPPGVDFREVIDDTVRQCRFFLAVIGPRWVTPRLHHAGDFVRLELEAALARGIPLVPVLVDGAAMPNPEDLPESLRPLVYRNATTLRPGRHFAADIEQLMAGLHRAEEWKRSRPGMGGAAMAAPDPLPGAMPVARPTDMFSDVLTDWNEYLRQEQVYEPTRWLETQTHRHGRWERAEAGGSPEARVLLLECQRWGIGRAKEPEHAHAGFLAMAGAGTAAVARRIAAEMLLNGHEVPKDEVAGLTLLRDLTPHNERVALCRLGLCHEQGTGGLGKNPDEAMRWYQRAAEAGDLYANVLIGFLYQDGDGVNRNDLEALKWFRKAAEAGHLNGMIAVGHMYYSGRGVRKDVAAAESWYDKALAVHPLSGCRLGYDFQYALRGLRAVDINFHRAIRYFIVAADAGDALSMECIGDLYAEGGPGLPQHKGKALEWYRKAQAAGQEVSESQLRKVR